MRRNSISQKIRTYVASATLFLTGCGTGIFEETPREAPIENSGLYGLIPSTNYDELPTAPLLWLDEEGNIRREDEEGVDRVSCFFDGDCGKATRCVNPASVLAYCEIDREQF